MIEVISHLNVITQYQDDRYADEDQAQDFANFTEFVLEEYEKKDVESPLEVSKLVDLLLYILYTFFNMLVGGLFSD